MFKTKKKDSVYTDTLTPISSLYRACGTQDTVIFHCRNSEI